MQEGKNPTTKTNPMAVKREAGCSGVKTKMMVRQQRTDRVAHVFAQRAAVRGTSLTKAWLKTPSGVP